MKGKEWYQSPEVAAEYEDKRFSGGGRLINQRETEAVLSSVEPGPGRDILEIACGTGRFTVSFAEAGADVVGLDISGPMLAQGRKKAESLGLADDIDFMRGDAARLPFPDNHFDVVVAIRFFHLADEPETFLEEMARVSRDRIVFDTFNRFSSRSMYNWLLPMGSRLYSRFEVDHLFDQANLELIEEQHDFIFPYGVYRKLPKNIAEGLLRLESPVHSLPGSHFLASVSFWSARVSG